MLLGMFKHLMNWITAFLTKYKRLTAFDKLWRDVEGYPGFRPFSRAYREVTQWQGSEMRSVACIILPILAGALQDPKPAEKAHFAAAIKCAASLIDFYLMTLYLVHSDETINYMKAYLADFHRLKDVFLEFHAYKKVREGATQVATEMRKTLEAETRADTGQISRSNRETITREVNDARIEYQRDNAHFNIPKLHLLSHFAGHIKKFGSIPQGSTEFTEAAHKEQINDEFRRSNRVNYIPQILAGYDRRHSMKMKSYEVKGQSNRASELESDFERASEWEDESEDEARDQEGPGVQRVFTTRYGGRSSPTTVGDVLTSYGLRDRYVRNVWETDMNMLIERRFSSWKIL
jgi:hypothetical protein